MLVCRYIYDGCLQKSSLIENFRFFKRLVKNCFHVWGEVRLCQTQTYSNATPTTAPAEVKYKVYSRRSLKRERRRRQCMFYDPLINKECCKRLIGEVVQSWFSLLEVATTAFTFKTLLRHYAKQLLAPW